MTDANTYTFSNKRNGKVATVHAYSLESALDFVLKATDWKKRDIRLEHPFRSRINSPAWAEAANGTH